jgi:uncharacterized protein (DUF2236 family)
MSSGSDTGGNGNGNGSGSGGNGRHAQGGSRAAATDPLGRFTALGQQLALAPLQLPAHVLAALAAPVRSSIRHDVRRSLGVPHHHGRPEVDPELAFLRPGGVARRVHADLPAMVIGGLSALLLQTLHPLAMAGVAEHSNYADDPVGGLPRTAAIVGYNTIRPGGEGPPATPHGPQVHRRVHGVAPDGRPYSAADPELVTWVHVAEMSSFLHAVRRFGNQRLTADDVDAYFAETAAVAYELGAEWVPRSADEVEAYFRRVRPELYAGPQAVAARDFLLRGVGTRPEDRVVYAVIASAAVSLLPGWARGELRIPAPPLVDAVVVVPVARAQCTGLRWAVAPPSPMKAA